ncbi:MAG: DNA primase [Bacteroidales bacterium]|jgi:DNA primase|nr:DNA primase [Bacteroidales bacterium]MCH3939804.1 DNA primase [Bacteroidales bacterium]MCI2135751.1 DNA primase [Bacteroidales bacterium]MDY6319911.1 DNA primase [Bacteroidales bacterium]MDY6377287.1 DNA primase [Bacteroidales bacterium]
MIPDETVRQILDAAKVEEVVGDFVSLRRRGSEYWACCPFHNEKTPSFHIVPSKGIYYCFGCHKGGSAVGFVMDYEHMSYVEALRYLAKKYNIEIHEKEETAEDIANRQRRESMLLVTEYASKFFHEQLRTEEGRNVGLAYFHSRGLEDETIEKYGLGWAPSDRRSFTDAAKAAGYKDEYLLDTGLCARYDNDGSLHDRFYDRVVFPVHSISGRVIAFGARTLKKKEEGQPYAKYVNSKESEIYVKNKSLYGIWHAKKEMGDKDKCYLVEGYLDVLSMHQLGITNVVASSGTSLTEGQIQLIKRFTSNVTLMYDGDDAGIHGALRGIDMFLREGMNVRVVLIPDGDDPDSYSRKHTLAEVQDFLAGAEQDFLEFKATYLLKGTERDPVKRATVINEIADSIASIPDMVKREVYLDALSEKFGIRREALSGRVDSSVAKNIESAARASSNVPYARTEPSSDEPQAAILTSTDGVEALENDSIMGKGERGLLNFVLTDGTSKLVFETDMPDEKEEEAPTVFDYICQALEDDNVEFTNDIYRNIWNAYSKEYYDGYSQEVIVRHLLDGEDRQVAFVTAQLSNNERYKLSVKDLRDSLMSHDSWLVKYVPKAILVFQSCRLDRRLTDLRNQLEALQKEGDESGQPKVMDEIIRLQKLQLAVKQKLGRGVNY